MRACSGVWVAHGSGTADRETVDRNDHVSVPPGDEFYHIRRVWLSEEEQMGDEGCLSFPGIFVPVKRGQRARVRAQDLDGKVFEIEGEGLFARALQHENDHLSGRLLIDMVGPVKRQIIKRKMRKEAEVEAP